MLAHPATRWLLVEDNTYRFLTGLFALLASGKQILLPPNAHVGTLADASRYADALLGAQVHSAHLHSASLPTVPITLHSALTELPDVALPILDKQLTITLLTSGSTGTPKHVTKTLAQLDTEIAALESLWGNSLGDAVILSTVSHQHIYGLLFRLLWPLCGHRAFATDTQAYPESLLAEIRQHKRVVLMSSPAQLSRFPVEKMTPELATQTVMTFSSGGELSIDAATRWHEQLGASPVEVFGSTETGGVAWRQQRLTPDWQPLPDVRLHTDPDGNLMVSSPWFSPDTPLAMGDCARIAADGTFTLLGRADRVVKIAEKRVSLNAMEQHLCEHLWIASACVFTLPGHDRLCAVVTLTPAGLEAMHSKQKRNITDSLRTHLLSHFERVVLPRKWRFPDALPMNTQGKTTLADLHKLFAPPASHRQDGVLIDCIRHTPQQKILHITLPQGAAVFEGHFPDLPILPGVVQFDIAMHACADWHPLTSFRRIDKLKFKEPVIPGDCVTLTLDNLGQGRVQFHYQLQDRPLSSGVIVFEL